jgi:hypothetical protein
MNMEHFVVWELAGETEVLGENLPYYHFAQDSTWADLGSNPDNHTGKPELYHGLLHFSKHILGGRHKGLVKTTMGCHVKKLGNRWFT